MTRDRHSAIARAQAYLDTGQFETDLARRVAHRTESQKPDNTEVLYAYLIDEIVPEFERNGFECTQFDNPVPSHGSVLLASRREDPGLPTVLGYGHGDVILGQDNQWQKGLGPWQLCRDCLLYTSPSPRDQRGSRMPSSA